MSETVSQYSSYRDSELDWIKKVPEHWEITHLKRLCGTITDGAHTSPDSSSEDYPFLTVVNLNNGELDFENCLYTSTADYEKLVRNGCKPQCYDVLYSKDGTISETTVVTDPRDFVVGSSFIILRPRQKVIYARYLSYLLSSSDMRYQARVYVKGASLPRISIFNVSKLTVLVPSIQEQKGIADYLETKTAQIDRKIDLLEQKALKYGELKQSLINESVTRGLDSSVLLKDSEIEWLGKIPSHWTAKRVKELGIVVNGATPKSGVGENWGNEYIWVTTDDLGKLDSRYIADSRRKLSKTGLNSCGTTLCKVGSIVISCRAPIGHLGILTTEACTNQGCKTLQLNSRLALSSFIYYSFLSRLKELQALGRGTTFIELSTKEFSLFKVALPPIAEQKAIADYLDAKTAHIDKIVTTIRAQIEKLTELRKTLINDVVTGKIKIADV